MTENGVYTLKKSLIICGIVVGVLLVIFLILKLSIYMAPFIIAFVLSALMEPLVKLMVKKLRLNRKLAAVIAILLFLSTVGLVITLIVLKIISELKVVYNALPDYYDKINNSMDTISQKVNELHSWLPEEISANIGNFLSSLPKYALGFVENLVKGVVNTAISIPEAIIFVIVTILSTYFLSGDRDTVYGSIKAVTPSSMIDKLRDLKENMFSALFGYVRTQLILMAITFTELTIGFSLIGVKEAMLLALVISFVDALPILGVGGVLVPWAIYEFIVSDMRMAVSLLIIYGIVLVVRQLIEPKILGQQIGVHPLLTLITMYAGLKFLGFIGLIIGPISLLMIKNIVSPLIKNGTIDRLIKKQ